MNSHASHRYCCRCHHLLAEGGDSACPRCGRRFDPADPATFDQRRRGLRGTTLRQALVLLAVIVATLAAWSAINWMNWARESYVIARLERIAPKPNPGLILPGIEVLRLDLHV